MQSSCLLLPNNNATSSGSVLVGVWQHVFEFLEYSPKDRRLLSLQCRLFRDACETLTRMWKNLALHPIKPPDEILRFAKALKTADKTRWTRSVARAFGPALKASKRCNLLYHCYVEALHPRWSRWRCAKVVLTTENVIHCLGISHELAGIDPNTLKPSQSAQIFKRLAEESFIKQGNNTSTEATDANDTHSCPIKLDLLFYDGELHKKVDAADMRSVNFASIPLLEASDTFNHLRLLQLIRNSTTLRSSETLRLGCSLVISQTVGNTNSREALCCIGCARVIVDAMHDRRHALDGDLMESLSRVCMNLVCSDHGIDDFVDAGGITQLLRLMKEELHLRRHSGFIYSSLKTLHNIAIEHDQHRRTMLLHGVMDIIKLAKTDHPDVKNLQSWSVRATRAICSFDGPNLTYASVMAELAVINGDNDGSGSGGSGNSNGNGGSNGGSNHVTAWGEHKNEEDAQLMLEEWITAGNLEMPPPSEEMSDPSEDGAEDFLPEEIEAVMSPGGSIMIAENEGLVDEDALNLQ